MSSSRWDRVEELFHAALEREPASRHEFLNDACGGDAELRREVESLLGAVADEADFMDRPAMELEAETMSQEPSGALSGRRIAHYLMGPLAGVGGMAEVYRARDTNLDRDVAIKVLLGSSSLDADGVSRFKREARLLASVTHPNVAAVYGFEQVDGKCALAMELVEGETLSDRIGRERMSIDEALATAGQVAAALDAAHSREIIHRDLKPANIRLAKDGTVKVLDFGLAKIFQPTEDRDTLAKTILSTEGHAIVGTVAYMSPEHARGQPVGRTTDIWAWGCVLYELLTGTRAFEGSGWTDTIARIASEDPDWTRLPTATPAAVRSLLEDCLQKDFRRRPQTIAEVQRRLQNAPLKTIPTAPAAEWSLSVHAARVLFLMIQFGFLAMYLAALYHVNTLDETLLPIVAVSAMVGIAGRLFLISTVALSHSEGGRKFNRLFPVLLIQDAAWAASPFLIHGINFGIALAGSAGLAYLPFSQRTLMQRIYSA